MRSMFYYFDTYIDYTGELLQAMIKLGVFFIVFLAALCLAIAIVVKIGSMFKKEEKPESGFWTNLNFQKRSSHGIDLIIIVLLGIMLIETPYNSKEFLVSFALVIGIRVLLYFAIKAETKKK